MEVLNSRLGNLFTQVEANVAQSSAAFREVNSAMADRVIQLHKAYVQNCADFEEECMRVLALLHPVAIDLRTIMLYVKFGYDLERMNALTSRIAKKTKILAAEPNVSIPLDFKNQIDKVEQILKLCRNLLLNSDLMLVNDIKKVSQEVHGLKANLQNTVEKMIVATPGDARRLLGIFGISRHLDRIADLTTGIAADWAELHRR